MKVHIFFSMLCFLMKNQAVFSQDYTTSTSTPGLPGPMLPSAAPPGTAPPEKAPPGIQYPAIKLSANLAQKIFFDSKRRLFNCPALFDNSINYPAGTAIALCNDAQLACLRYGLLLKEMEIVKGRVLEELQRILVIQKDEITIRLRGCQLALKRSINGEDIMTAAGYIAGYYGGVGLSTPQSDSSSSVSNPSSTK